MGFFDDVGDFFHDAGNEVWDTTKSVGSFVGDQVDKITDIPAKVVGTVDKTANNLIDTTGNVAGKGVDAFANFFDPMNIILIVGGGVVLMVVFNKVMQEPK
jgi:hypothetical protein